MLPGKCSTLRTAYGQSRVRIPNDVVLHRVPLSGLATSLLLGIKEDAKKRAEADGIPISPFHLQGVEGRALTDIKRT
jgi:hypothetical protein